MAARNLTPQEMLPISSDWLDTTGKANAAITSVPELAATLPRVELAHSLLAKLAQPAGESRLGEIIAEEARLDVRHDTIIRGSFGYLTCTAELLGGDEGDSLIALRDTLFPDGLSGQLKTYRAQAGAAALLAGRMTAALRQRTDGIVIGQTPSARTLTSYIDELIDIGAQFDVLETERGQLEAATNKADLYNAKLGWVRAANAMIANGELGEISAEQEKVVFGPFREAEKKADERARQEAKARAKGKDGGTGTGP